MRNPIAGVICAVVSGKKIMLNEQNDEWVLPMGDIEGKEQPKDAAKRIVTALTGKSCETTTVRGLISYKKTEDGTTEHRLLHLCMMKLNGKLDKNDTLKWFMFKKLSSANLGIGMDGIIQKMVIKLEATYYECVIEDGVLEHFAPL